MSSGVRFFTYYSSSIVLLALLLSACQPAPQEYSAEFLAMGTTVSITLVSNSARNAQRASDDAQREIERLGREWYPWRPEGELPKLNAAIAAGHSKAVSAELANILNFSAKIYRDSNGAFDPTLGALVKLWGFDVADVSATRALPNVEQIQAWRANHPTFADLTITDHVVSSRRTDLILDLGAIGKGYAVDRAIEILRANGIHDALVNAGGNLRAIGNSDKGAWRIAIHDPRSNDALYTLALANDESVSTSADDQRFVVQGSHRWSHLLDPRSGQPAEQTIAVTVLAANATLADAASTAIFVAGPDKWQAVAKRLGIKLVLRIDATHHLQVSRALLPRLQPAKRDALQLVVEAVDL